MNFLHKTFLAGSALAISMSANAGEFYVDLTGPGLGTNDAITNLKDQLDFSYDSRTVITLTDTITPAVNVGDAIVTTGGLDFTSQATLNASFDNNRFSGFLPGSDSEGFLNDRTSVFADSANLGTWGLSFGFNLIGEIAATSGGLVSEVSYSSGLIEIFLIEFATGSDDITATNIFDLTVTGSSFDNASNFIVNGIVSFSGDESHTDMFHLDNVFCLGDDSFHALATCVPPVEVAFKLDQNLDEVSVDFSNVGVDGTGIIAGDHNGSLQFNSVPEPSILALLGSTLFAFGAVRRRKV